MKELKLVRPSIEYKEQAIEYINEFIKYGSKIHGVASLNNYLDNYEEWLSKLEFYRNMIPGSVSGRVPAETFMLVRESNDRLIGMIDIRLMLNEYLLNYGGHIGYSIRPTERQKGYNKIQLYLGLLEEQKVGEKRILLDCTVDNIGSNKSIISLGGILEKTEIDENDNKLTNYYWIDVDKAISENLEVYSSLVIIDPLLKIK